MKCPYCGSSCADSALYCPNCKQPLEYAFYHYNHIGKFHCPSCGLRSCPTAYTVTSADLDESSVVINEKHRLRLAFSSFYMMYNTLAAFAAASLLGVAPESIVMNVGTAAVGYGYEYVASTLDRVRAAALAQSDADLQMPIIAPTSTDTWGVKESVVSEEDMPEWGCQEERGIDMEVATAAANLTGGADAVVMRHPAAVATIKKFITELV